MMAASRFTGSGLIEIQRSNLRALLRHLHREQGSWVRVAHALGYRRAVVVGFFDGTEPGNMALARSIARAVGLSLDDALAGKAPPRKPPSLVLVTSPKRKGGAR
ncbi:hypothetical protein [Polyangium jinanense]|uniref:Uncharacterized protein n=1 Tax=Polyangium jinanense TaxID=2829994 RepID=A0A9X4B0P7_9BACT|nr:hypothetical protein [Polyangium jinanense]MDC3962657.1 hypothetical protein [Polyangium jinanense]MDC3989377.1 hypothetical protein [Polyangium jinanense]